MFERVKRYYDLGLYSKAQVAMFIRKGKLTAEQYEAITGEAYEDEPEPIEPKNEGGND